MTTVQASTNDYIENRTFDEIEVGDSSKLVRTLRQEDIQMYAIMSGDINPSHVDPEYAHSSMLREVIAHGMWGGALISNVLGTQFPGPGTVYVDQTLHFDHPVRVGDTVTVTITCEKKFPRNHHMIFDCVCTNQDGQKVITGTAEVLAPTEKVKRPKANLPDFIPYGPMNQDAFKLGLISPEKAATLVLQTSDVAAMRTTQSASGRIWQART